MVLQETSRLTVRTGYSYSLAELIRQRAWVEIDLSALAHNVTEVKKILAPRTELMAVVKADAYGHGAVRVAETVLEAGATWLAIATLGEGIALREAGITAPILILGAINTPEEIEAIAHWQLQPTICNCQQALTFSQTMARLGKKIPVHLKLDTGMSRLGTLWHEAADFVELVTQLPQLHIVSIYSHFATADDPDTTMMELQHQRFEQAISQIKAKGIKIPLLHIANSAATLCAPAGTFGGRSLHHNLVRVGLALYGLYPAPHLQNTVNLKPVLQVKAKITQIKTLAAGTGVSYGHRFKCDRDLQVAVVSIGYADGIPRNLSNRLEVLLRGQRISQIGTITMDQLMLDISNIPNPQVGEVVTLIGKDGEQAISADDWANTLGTISWEILCGFKHRLPRISI